MSAPRLVFLALACASAARAPVAAAPVAPVRGAWAGLSPAAMRAALPAEPGARGAAHAALRRQLDRAGVAPEELAAAEPGARAGLLRERLMESARAALARPRAAGLAAAQARLDELEDLAALAEGPLKGEGLRLEEARAEAAWERARLAEAETAAAVRDLGRGKAEWSGRSAVVYRPEGAVVLEFARPGEPAALERGRSGLERARAAGLDAPRPLGAGTSEEGPRRGHGREFVASLVLPDSMYSRGRPAGGLEASALGVIDELLRFDEAGLSRGPLTPLGGWRWDRWTFGVFTLPGLPYGPASLRDWRGAAAGERLRPAGLGDLAGLAPAGDARDRAGALAEWSLLVLGAARDAGLGPRGAAEVLVRGFRRHAEGLLPGARVDERRLRASLRKTARRFQLFAALARGPLSGLPMPGLVLRPLALDVLWPYARALQGREPRIEDRAFEALLSPGVPERVDWPVVAAVVLAFLGGSLYTVLLVLAAGVAGVAAYLAGGSPNTGAHLMAGAVLVGVAAAAARAAVDAAALLAAFFKRPWIRL